jgi:hypothetical protein
MVMKRGASGLLILAVAGLVAGSGLVAAGATSPRDAAAKVPTGTKGQFNAVSAVPHSSDAWALGSVYNSSSGKTRYFEARRHHGHWQRVAAPNLGGSQGVLGTVAAASGRVVWIGGGRQQGHGSIQDFPAIWQWTGKKFVLAKFPPLFAGASSVADLSASSTSNAWGVGEMSPPDDSGFVVLHWNGKKWSTVPVPEGFRRVSTSGPDNAWAIGLDDDNDFGLFHWDGKSWTADGTVPAGVQLDGIATSGPKLAYAVGFNAGGRTVIMRFNGTTWSNAKLAKGTKADRLWAVSIHGTSAWAVGYHLTAGDVSVPVILHTTGGTWKSQGAEPKSISFADVSAESANRAYAVGAYEHGVEVRTVDTFFDVYAGHSWKPAGSKF